MSAAVGTPSPVVRLSDAIAGATARVAPTWPLDRLIAVNPYWGWLDRPMPDAAAALGLRAGTQLTPPREWFRGQWQSGLLQRRHLVEALRAERPGGSPSRHDEAGLAAQADALENALQGRSPAPPRLPLVTDLRDRGAPPRPGGCWADLVVHQISQHCAAFFDRRQATWTLDHATGLYPSWREQLAADRGLTWRQGRAALRDRLAALPATAPDLVAAALEALAVPADGHEAYLGALLMTVGGWAAWCAHERWEARLRADDDDTLVHLLAIRLAWEWLLFEDATPGTVERGWAAGWRGAQAAAETLRALQRTDWLLQSAAEIAYREPLIRGLSAPPAVAAPPAPAVQALFCIDVRSEVLRRALESVAPAVQTRGCAGFFGLPIAYSPLGTALQRPQLPGLLAPTRQAGDAAPSVALGQQLAGQRRRALQWRQRWDDFRRAPASAFGAVESTGLAYGAKLVASSLPSAAVPRRWEDTGLPARSAVLRRHLPDALRDPAGVAVEVGGILRAMGLAGGFAPLIVLVGHAGRSANNPHAAALDCGACGGQSGEVNARVLADILNTPAVREQLRRLGIDLPDTSHVLAALHDTTTDEVTLHDTDAVPAAQLAQLRQLRHWFDAAGARARAERAPGLGLAAEGDDAALLRSLRERANDWAQVRPEWGLAGNASLIVAPRTRSRHLDLAGRSFLHDYDHRLDPDRRVLAQIMTAPMVVANWINLQYHASTVDNRRYGSGDKNLHNVVGARLGVFEGNGGDLRIGLPMQSVHDGRGLRHAPLRLSVFVEAPQAALDAVMADHAVVRMLVGHGWLHLFRIDPDDDAVEQHRHGAWIQVAAAS